tara:strand:- start:94 stop:483 length:390 start_codon:yes stop_codon:yes gene_type:complete
MLDQIASQLLRHYQIALIDDEFSLEEWNLLVRFAEARNISESKLKEIVSNPIGEIVYPKEEKEKLEYLLELSKMIWVDGKVTKEERKMFINCYYNFGLPSEFEELILENILEKNSSGLSLDKLVEIILF